VTEFQQALTAHPGINGVVVPNDENAAPIITYLKTLGTPADKFPVTGQDATLIGIQNVISGYQCGTVYKPIYVEAQAAAAVALYLRAGKPVPASLANGTTKDTTANVAVKSILLGPEWVTPTNVQSTVVKDKFVPASQICVAPFGTDCTKYGIG
jgi:D-xylose transport system substrate-binding protein